MNDTGLDIDNADRVPVADLGPYGHRWAAAQPQAEISACGKAESRAAVTSPKAEPHANSARVPAEKLCAGL